MAKLKVENKDRRRMITMHLDGYNKQVIAATMQIPFSSVCNILRIYDKTGRIEALTRGGIRECKLTPVSIAAIRSWIDEDCGITLNVLRTKLINAFNIRVSTSTINRAIGSFHYTCKRTSLIPERRNCSTTLELRRLYAQEFNDLVADQTTEHHFYFIDEVGFNLTMRTRRGRSLKGHRANHSVPGLRSRNISVCCVMSKDGIGKYTVQTVAFNSLSYLAFIQQFLADLNRDQISNAILVMDNVPFHKKVEIKQEILAAGHRPLYLPPYSPFLNPIENMFSKWKQSIRRNEPTSHDMLLELIDQGSRLITREDCVGYYSHMLSFLPDSLNGIPIEEG